MNLVARLSKLERNRDRNADAFAHLSDYELTARIEELDRLLIAAADISQAQLTRLQRETTCKPALLEPDALAALVAGIKQEAEAHA